MTGSTPMTPEQRRGGDGVDRFMGRPFPAYQDPTYFGQRTTGRLPVDRNPLYHSMSSLPITPGTGTHAPQFYHAYDDAPKPFKVGWKTKRPLEKIPLKRESELAYYLQRETYNEGSRRLRGEAIQASENRNNFNPIQHTTRRPGAAAPVVDTNAWQHEKLHFHPTAPPSPQLQQDRFNRSVGILALRSDRIANEGRPPSKRFQNSVSETLNWHYPKPSSPGIDASPLRSSFVGKAMAWREHDPAQCRPQDPSKFNRSQLSNNVKGCLSWD